MDQGTAVLVGRLAADPKFFGEGDSKRAVFSIAYNRGRGDNRKANFIDCIAWGKRADIMNDFKKGSGIFITGDIEQDTYEKKDTGEKRNRVQVNVSSITATASTRRKDGEGSFGGGSGSDEQVSIGAGGGGNDTDDIPF